MKPVTEHGMAKNDTGPYRTATARWSFVGLLMSGMVLSLIDRQIISLLVEPIKADLGLSDTQFSLLVGPAFVVFYLLFGLPFGWLADRIQRRHVIALGVAVWSTATMLCGFAWSFLSLAAARATVGAGEASLMPSSMSILSDLFSRQRLPFVTSIFSISMHIGSAAALLVGGVILGVLGDTQSVSVPLVGELAPWQLTFVLVGLPGLVLAAVFMLVPEPRRATLTAAASAGAATDNSGLTVFMQRNARTIAAQFAAASVLTVGTYAFVSWSPAYLIRAHGLSSDHVAFVLGVIMLVCGPAGTLGGGLLSGWLLDTRGRKDASWLVMMLSAAGSGVFGVIAFTSATATAAFIFLAAAILFGSLYIGIVHAALQVITPGHLRGRMAAIMLIFMTGVGASGGPVVVALITDFVFADPLRVGVSVAIVAAAVGCSVCALLGFNLSHYRDSYSRAETIPSAHRDMGN